MKQNLALKQEDTPLYEMCLGHLIPRKTKCYTLYECNLCEINEENKNCPNYKPIRTFEVLP
jgi:hypothetical protein